MNVQTMTDLKRAKAMKIKLTSKGYEATLKGDTPDEVVAFAGMAYEKLTAMRSETITPGEKAREDFPALILESDGTYKLQKAGGLSGPWNPVTQAVDEDYRVRVDFILNSKGPGWEITVNKCASIEEAVALLDYTEKAMQKAFLTEAK